MMRRRRRRMMIVTTKSAAFAWKCSKRSSSCCGCPASTVSMRTAESTGYRSKPVAPYVTSTFRFGEERRKQRGPNKMFFFVIYLEIQYSRITHSLPCFELYSPKSLCHPHAPGISRLIQMAAEPVCDRAVPLHRVLCLQAPMILVGEYQEFALDTTTL